MIALLLFISVAFAQHKCSTAKEVLTFPFQEKLSFGNSIEDSYINPEYNKEAVKAHYIKFTGTAESVHNIYEFETCSVETKVATKFYIFTECTDDVASNLVLESGYDPDCASGFNFPSLNFNPEEGKTYYLVVALLDPIDQGTVVVNTVVDNTAVFTNANCANAIEINLQEEPFEMEQHIINTKITPSTSGCHSQETATLWYKYVGEGKQMLVSTCNYFTTVDTKIAIVKGSKDTTTCDNLSCVKLGDDGCGTKRTATVMAFMAEKDQVYFIGVHANLKTEGQFKIMVDYLSDNLPSTCPNAVPIPQLPFSYKVEVGHDWPAAPEVCSRQTGDHRSVYFQFTGTGHEVVFSTCKSFDENMDMIGTHVELINNCEDNECAFHIDDFHSCGENMYVVKKTEKGQVYILRMFCSDTKLSTCPLTINVYEKSEAHDTCEHARQLENPGTFNEIAVVENLQTSAHGCTGSAVGTVPGLWYRLYHDTSLTSELYTIRAMNAHKSAIGWIELPYGCGSYYCEQEPVQGEVTVSFTSNDIYQYIFVYPDQKENQEALIVQFINEAVPDYIVCENALEIELPFTALHTFEEKQNSLVCDTKTTSANYYKFHVKKSQQVDISTCFSKTLVDTGIEITSGCKDKGGRCLTSKTSSDGCATGAVKLSAQVDADVDYILTIYSEAKQAFNIKQYRMVAFTEEVPANSMCSSATELPYKDGYANYLVLNRYGRLSNFGEQYGHTSGSWFHIKAPGKVIVTVRTCSPDTTTNSFIVTAGECTTDGLEEAAVSTPKDLSKLAKSSEINCDIHGTYITFEVEPEESRYIFVGPETFGTDCFIRAEFYMDCEDCEDPEEPEKPEKSSATPEKPEEPEDPANKNEDDKLEGWAIALIVICVLVCVVAIVAVGVVLTLFLLKKRKSTYTTLA